MLFGAVEVINISSEGTIPVPPNSFHMPIIMRDSDDEDEAEYPNLDVHKLPCQKRLFSNEYEKNMSCSHHP